MKRTILALVTLIALLLSCATVYADSQTTDYSTFTNEELIARIAELEQANADLEAQVNQLNAQVKTLKGMLEQLNSNPKPTAAATPAPTPASKTLQKGDKGDAVKKLQNRLKELNYLSGSADGDYGNMTVNAVKAFQKEAGLSQTGVADEKTQNALYAANAPKSKVYNKINYKAIARDPDAHKGDYITFSGKILQVMESGNTVIFRISSKGNYDDVVYCTYTVPANYKRFLEDDKVTVYGVCTGIYSYESVMHSTITIPSCTIDRIELR